MSTLLQLDSAAWNHKVSFTQYASLAAELLHSSRDAIEALTSFRELAFHLSAPPGMPTASWLDFDAHPGDCACQIRPAGLHLLVCAFQIDRNKTEHLLQDTLYRLRHVEAVAKETFHQLCSLNLTVTKIGSGLDRKAMTRKDFCYAIGAGTWFDKLDQHDYWLVNTPLQTLYQSRPANQEPNDANHAESPSSNTEAKQKCNCSSMEGCHPWSPEHSCACTGSSQASSSIRSCSTKVTPASSTKGDDEFARKTISSHRIESSTLSNRMLHSHQPKVQFQVDDWSFVVKWIAICFSIGRYRQVLPSKKKDSLIYRIGVSVRCLCCDVI